MEDRVKVLQTFFAGDRLTAWPAKHSKQLVILEELMRDFRPGALYTEEEVNHVLLERFDDYCLIRRMFIVQGFMSRSNGVYEAMPRHQWPAFRERCERIAEHLLHEYALRSDVLAMGCFGSLSKGQLWEHSDLDLLLVMNLPQPQTAYQEINGVQVHWQLLTPTLLQNLDRAGLPLLQALSGLCIWSDPTGLLEIVVTRVKRILCERLPEVQFKETMRLVDQLHLTEKYLSLGHELDARVALANALQSLAMIQAVDRGEPLPRRSFPADDSLSSATNLADSLKGESVRSVLQQVWSMVRPRLAQLAQPLLQVIAELGPVSYPELERHPMLRGQGLSERLLQELFSAGLVNRTTVAHPIVGSELRFTPATVEQ